MKKEKKGELRSLKEIIQKNPSKFPLGFQSLIELRVDAEKDEPGATSSFYKTKTSSVFLHHSPVSKPPLF